MRYCVSRRYASSTHLRQEKPDENRDRMDAEPVDRLRHVLMAWLSRMLRHGLHLIQWFLQWRTQPSRRRGSQAWKPARPRTFRAQPKPKWVKHQVIRLKAVMPHAGCRTITHHFNRQWAARRDRTVSKTYVADLCRQHQYLIYEARRKLKHRMPRSIPRNRIRGCDLLTSLGSGLGAPPFPRFRIW